MFRTLIICLWLLSDSIVSFSQDTLHKHLDKLEALYPYLDSIVLAEMQEYNVPGAVVAIVHDSSYLFNKGYGLADIASERSVNSEKTGFRVASITKTFTATAALILVQEGKLDLHTNIANYLPDYDYGFLSKGPITMHQLLTHTAGFETTDIFDAAMEAGDVLGIEEIVRHHMPYMAHPPGTVYNYSNFGYTLAGYVIEQVSGKPYPEFIDERILAPLGMDYSSMDQPLENPVKNHMASSYLWKGHQEKYIRDYTQVVPADALVTSGRDMGNYMLMHLNEGKYKDLEILAPDYHRLITTQQYGGRRTEFGIGYGFFEGNWTGRRTLEHSGGQLGFASVMILEPETGTGIFIAHNSREGANRFRYEVIRPVLDSLLGQEENKFIIPEHPASYDTTLSIYTGVYRQMNYPKGSYEKIGLLFDVISSEWEVVEVDDTLNISGYKFLPFGDHIFYNHGNPSWKVDFMVTGNGHAERLTSGLNSYERISWYQRSLVLQILMGLGLVILIVMFVARPAQALVSRLRRKPMEYSRDWIYEWMYFTGSVFTISFLVIILEFSIHGGQLNDYGIPYSIRSSLFANALAGISSLLFVVAIWKILSSKEYTIRRKVAYMLGILGIVITALGSFYLNLMKF